MKRPQQGGNGGDGGGPDNYSRRSRDRVRRNRHRLGGKGLSLVAFANAKSTRNDFNPARIKKQREFYKNAKYISKYKNSLKQLQMSENQTLVASQLPESSAEDQKNINMKMKRKAKTKYNLESVREEYEKKREEQQKARMEREAAIQAKKEARERADAQRKDLRVKMFKKTRSGQPIMKYRIEHILEGLQDSKN